MSLREEVCYPSVQETFQIMGGKWAFLVISQLYIKDQRFNELRRSLDNISTKALTDTLRHLEQNGVVERRVFPTVPVTVEYSITDKGKEFQPVIYEMCKWIRKWGHAQKRELEESATTAKPTS